jgi:dTDP-4-dehydrorhamnose reductase
VDDQYGKPTYGIDLAKAILANLNHPGLFKHNTYHFAQGPETNWFGFAQKIVEISGNDCEVKPILSSAYPTLAKRPMNSVLDTQRMEKNLSLNSRNWEDALLDCIKSIKNDEEF